MREVQFMVLFAESTRKSENCHENNKFNEEVVVSNVQVQSLHDYPVDISPTFL